LAADGTFNLYAVPVIPEFFVIDTGYVVYIDEAGDFGLKAVAPIDVRGASEWFIMSGVVVRKENERKVPQWLRIVRDKAKNNQSIDLHFRTLSDRQKGIICEATAKLPMRLFVVISNKQNMRGYKNQSANYISKHKHWFYWWIARLLLERVTDFCATRNRTDGTPGLKLEVEFSRRKDLRLKDFTDYFTRLWLQGDTAFLNKRRIEWSVFDFQNVNFFDHQTRAGLQFADVVASAFFQAVNTHPTRTCHADHAILLEPRIHRGRNGLTLNEGFTVWPQSLAPLGLTEEQKRVFRHFRYPESRLTI
jgi:hypothetical protein